MTVRCIAVRHSAPWSLSVWFRLWQSTGVPRYEWLLLSRASSSLKQHTASRHLQLLQRGRAATICIHRATPSHPGRLHQHKGKAICMSISACLRGTRHKNALKMAKWKERLTTKLKNKDYYLSYCRVIDETEHRHLQCLLCKTQLDGCSTDRESRKDDKCLSCNWLLHLNKVPVYSVCLC